MSKIRINELARELEVKPNKILDLLPGLGVQEKKTHSSSIDEDVAVLVRKHFGFDEPQAKHGALDESVPYDEAPYEPAPKAPAADIAVAPPPPLPAATVQETMPAQEAPVEAAHVTPAPAPGRPAPIRPPLALNREGPGPRAHSVPTPPAAHAPHAHAAPPPVQQPQPPIQPLTPRPHAASIPARPTPPPRPGQILTGPRAPMPSGEPPKPAAPPTLAPPGMPAPPRPPQLRPSQPIAGSFGASAPGVVRPPARPNLVGQPAARPVVPPRPEVLERLRQQQQIQAKSAPGQPTPRPPMPGRPSSPTPGQPIYRGPIRPGQPVLRGPGMPPGPGQNRGGMGGGGGLRGRPMHPTSPLPPPGPVTPEQQRRRTVKGGPVREREREEGKLKNFVRRNEPAPLPVIDREIIVSEGITVKELSEKLGVKANLVIKKLVEKKIFATINQALDAKMAEELAREFGASINKVSYEEESTQDVVQAEVDTDRVPRWPVVTIMGHVDHGKTSLLDAIRQSSVAEREAGGITQHIGAYRVEKNGKKIVFIDTPGHEAFTRMRARGAKVTDIVILVVAADDGVMPQTIEAIDHAKAAGVPIIVAINKMDRPDATPDRVKQQLADRGLLAEDWGGDVVMVPVSARAKTNLDLLLEMILLVSEMLNLKANPDRPAVGSVLEAQLDRGRGPVATVLVRNGTLRTGDFFICGSVFGKVRALYDDRGEAVKEAEPSTPVEVLGLDTVPEVGDTFQVVTDTAKAKQIVMFRESKSREQAMIKSKRMSLDRLHEQLKEGEIRELNLIIKTDVGGTAEVLSETLQKQSTDKVRIRVLRAAVGAINESDVLLASTSEAIIIGFSVRPERNAAALAEEEKVDIRLHTIIYELVDEIKRAMTGMLAPVFKEVYKGRAEVRETFRITKVGTVAGCMVLDGVISRAAQVRLMRDNVVVHTGKVDALKRFKDDASEVKQGFECGISLVNFNDIKQGDIMEAFVTERVAPDLNA